MNKTEFKKRHKEACERLKNLMQEFNQMTPEQQNAIKEASSKLGAYSDRNKMLIWLQSMARGFIPSAVAPFNTWKKTGKAVKKGEKGLEILVPMTKKGKNAPTPDEGIIVLYGHDFSQNDGSTPERTFFKIGYVFDISQTEPHHKQLANI